MHAPSHCVVDFQLHKEHESYGPTYVTNSSCSGKEQWYLGCR
jgi:hypothetical protein